MIPSQVSCILYDFYISINVQTQQSIKYVKLIIKDEMQNRFINKSLNTTKEHKSAL